MGLICTSQHMIQFTRPSDITDLSRYECLSGVQYCPQVKLLDEKLNPQKVERGKETRNYVKHEHIFY